MTIRAGDQSEDVSEVQRILTEGGYYSGPVDGVYGPETEAAVRAYQTAHGLTVDGVVGPETWGNMHGDPNYPNNTTGALSGGASNSGSLNTNADAAVKERFPLHAYLLDADPEVAAIMREAAAANPPWAPDLLESKLMNTAWFKKNSDTARDYHHLQATDPATFQRELWENEDRVRRIGGLLGYDESVLDDGYVAHFANKAMREGLSDQMLQTAMVMEITPLIGTTEKSPILAQLREVSQAYGFLTDTTTQNYWLREIGAGRQTIEAFENTAKAWMKSIMPHLGNQIDQGLTWRQIQQPYKNLIERELELGPEQIDFMDPKWRHIIDYVDPKDGVHRSMSLREATSYVRSMDEWWDTSNGQEESAELTEEILTSFGAVRR
jgi:hypothetical protein